jgi:predicted transcriptional regulator
MSLMDTLRVPDDVARDHVETEADRVARAAWEAEGLAEALRSTEAGRLVESDRVKAWIDSIGTERELPVPFSGR